MVVFPRAFFMMLSYSSKKRVLVFISQLSFMVGCLSQFVKYHSLSIVIKTISSEISILSIGQPFLGKKESFPKMFCIYFSCLSKPFNPLEYQS